MHLNIYQCLRTWDLCNTDHLGLIRSGRHYQHLVQQDLFPMRLQVQVHILQKYWENGSDTSSIPSSTLLSS